MDIQIYDYLKEVESARKNLIQHCKDHNTPISDNASLSTTVGAIQTIDNYQDSFNTITDRDYENTVEVRFFDCDGTLLKQEIIPKGGSTTPPLDPNHDPERLEFNKWVSAIGEIYENLEHDVDYGATYKLKDNIQLVYFCRFTEYTGKKVCVPLYVNSSYARDIIVNWGDRSPEETVRISDWKYLPHEYENYGEYAITFKLPEGITFYNDYYHLNMTSNNIYYEGNKSWRGLLDCSKSYNVNQTVINGADYKTDCAVYKIYNKYLSAYRFGYAYNLDTIVTEFGFGSNYGFSGDSVYLGYPNVKNLIIPENNVQMYTYNMESYRRLYFTNIERLIISDKAFIRAKRTVSGTSLTEGYNSLEINIYNSKLDKLILPKVVRPEGNTSSFGYIINRSSDTIGYNEFTPAKHLIVKDYMTSYYGENDYGYSNIKVDRLELYKPLNIETPAYRYAFYNLQYNSAHLEIPNNYMKKYYAPGTLYSTIKDDTLYIEDGYEYNTSAIYTYQPWIKRLVIPQNFDYNLSIMYLPSLTVDCLIDILNRLRDKSEDNFSNTLTLAYYTYTQYISNYVTLNNGIYEKCSHDANGAINLLEAITSKNWTISISASIR